MSGSSYFTLKQLQFFGGRDCLGSYNPFVTAIRALILTHFNHVLGSNKEITNNLHEFLNRNTIHLEIQQVFGRGEYKYSFITVSCLMFYFMKS